jgi:tetratricopeptide (TPR) repeat protein
LLQLNPESERLGEMLEAVLQRKPRDVEATMLYAQWLCGMHREAEALTRLRKAIEWGPGDEVRIDIYRLQAAAEDALNRPEAAARSYRTAIDLNRRSAHPRIHPVWEYAQFLIRSSAETEARAVLERLLTAAPSFGPAHLALARILAHTGAHQPAIGEAKLALAQAPGAAEQKPIHIFLSGVCHSAGLESEAREHQQWLESH